MEKLLYISTSSYFDTDFSLIKSLKSKVNLYCLFFVYPDNLKNTMMQINEIYPKTGIFKAKDIYPEFEQFSEALNLDKTYIMNRLSRRKLSFANIISYFQLIGFILKNRFDTIYNLIIYHINDWPLMLFLRKTFTAIHDPFPHSGVNQRKVEIMIGNMVKRSKGIIIFNMTLSTAFKQKYNIPEGKLYIAQLGKNYLDKSFVRTIEDKYYSPYILFWGRIEPYKGVEYLLKAFNEVHETHKNVKLVIAGRGKPYFDETLYKDKDYIIFDNHFLSVSELANIVDKALFVVCPYKNATQSGVITTAFAFDKPVVGTNVGAIPEYVINNKFGIIVPSCNNEALRDAICKLLDHPELISQYSQNICNYYEKGEGSWDAISNEILNFMNNRLTQ